MSKTKWTYEPVATYRCGGDRLVGPTMIRQLRDTNQGDSLISVAVLGQGTTPGRAEAIAAKIVASLNATDGIADPAAFVEAAERLAEASRKMKAVMLIWRMGCATVNDCQETEAEFESALAAFDAAVGAGDAAKGEPDAK